MKRIRPFLCSLTAAISMAASANEPSIQAVTYMDARGGSTSADVYIDGQITPSLPRKLVSALAANRIESGTIYLNSVGGDLHAGLELGEFIRKTGFNTGVGKRPSGQGKPLPASCQSACLMVLAGGVFRYADAQSYLGIHRFYATSTGPNDLALGQVLSAAITGYLIRMGVDPALFEKMVNAGASMQKLSVNDAQGYRLINNGVLPASWKIVGKAGKVYLEGQQNSANGAGTLRLNCRRDGGLYVVAIYDAGRNAANIVRDTKHLSMRLSGAFVGVQPQDVVLKTSLQGTTITTGFNLSGSSAVSMSNARAIGFSWLPQDTSIFYGFDVPNTQDRDLVSSFVSHCASK